MRPKRRNTPDRSAMGRFFLELGLSNDSTLEPPSGGPLVPKSLKSFRMGGHGTCKLNYHMRTRSYSRKPNEAHHATPGTVLVINPGEVHDGHAGVSGGWRYRMIYPDVSLLLSALGGTSGKAA